MNWEMILMTVVPQLVGLGGLGTWQWMYTRKVQRRLEEANASLVERQAERADVDTDTEHYRRLNELIETLTCRLKDSEGRHDDQTRRLRETQDRELAANERAIALGVKLAESEARNATLEKQIGELKLRLKDYTCKKLSCLSREPQNEHTRRAIKAAETKARKRRDVTPETMTVTAENDEQGDNSAD